LNVRAVFGFGVALLAWCAIAHAHTHLLGSVPADGGVVATPPGTVVLTLSEPAPGTYVVSWRAASADGHVMPGRIRFTVSGGAASQGERR